MSGKDNSFTPDPYVPEFMQKIQAAARAEAANLSRRTFIKLTGVAGGGLVLALSIGPGARRALEGASRLRQRQAALLSRTPLL